MNQPVGPYDFWSDTLQPGLFGLYDRWTEQKPWPTPEQINAAVQNPGLLDREAMAGYAVDMAQPFAAKLGGLLGHMPIPEGGLFGITTWHGSPHKWTRPDISKVGTGEGAQAYGHGFYSAEAEAVAKGYKDSLSSNWAEVTKQGNPYNNDKINEAMELLSMNNKKITNSNVKEQLIKLKRGYELRNSGSKSFGNDPQKFLNDINEIQTAIDEMPYLRFNQEGYLYKLDIPDEDVAKYLDWDKPLSEQPEVFALLKTKFPYLEYAGHKNGEWALGEIGEGIGGLSFRLSQELSDAGIPGIRYLDGSSRSAGEGTYNYVTFDPSRIKVLERNGEDLRGLLGR